MIEIEENKSLDGMTTFGLSAKAEAWAEASSPEALGEAHDEAARRGWRVSILGGGSNTIALERVPGLVLVPAFRGVRLEARPDGRTLLTAGAAERLDDVVRRSVAEGLSGLENLAAIPGSVGGAVVQNAGAYGVELAERVAAVRVWDPESREVRTIDTEGCDFGYRTSLFKRPAGRRLVILEATFELARGAGASLGYKGLAARFSGRDPATVSPSEVESAVREIRAAKLPDPARTGSAGSFFKNPVVTKIKAREIVTLHPSLVSYPLAGGRAKLAAGWLIEAAGMVRASEGGAGVWPQHALVLVNNGGASARDVLRLSRAIALRVERRFGVALEPEPVLLGGDWADWDALAGIEPESQG